MTTNTAEKAYELYGELRTITSKIEELLKYLSIVDEFKKNNIEYWYNSISIIGNGMTTDIYIPGGLLDISFIENILTTALIQAQIKKESLTKKIQRL